MYRVFKCNVNFLIGKTKLFIVVLLAIPDDAMDVDRVVDEDKDNDPDKVTTITIWFSSFSFEFCFLIIFQRISQVQSDRRVADERELSDSEDEDGDNRRNQSNFKGSASNKRKASPEPVNGAAAPTVDVPSSNVENGSTNENVPTESTDVVAAPPSNDDSVKPAATTTATTTTEETNVKETTATTDGMDTSE